MQRDGLKEEAVRIGFFTQERKNRRNSSSRARTGN